MGKKKPFIDKKNSSTYHLLHRSQRDVGGEQQDGEDGTTATTATRTTILWPSPHNKAETDQAVLNDRRSHNDGGRGGSGALAEWKAQMEQVEGLLEDAYDYDQHMKPITGTGDFLTSDGHRGDAQRDARSSLLEEEIKEVDRQLDSIALSSDYMDDEIAFALFGEYEEGDYEEIQDDFCLVASQEPEVESTSEDAFDFDQHVQELMAKARKEREAKNHKQRAKFDLRHKAGRKDMEFFSKAMALHEKDNEDEDDDSGHFDLGDLVYETAELNEADNEHKYVVPALNPDEERALQDKFEQTLLEYDSDEVGDLEHQVEDGIDELRGTRELEGDEQIEAALDDFLTEKQDDIFIRGTKNMDDQEESPKRTGGSGFQVLHTQRDNAAATTERPEDVKMVLRRATNFLASPELDVPPEEILIDGKSYFSQSSRNPWDCETILSTYSNFDNTPVMIETSASRRRRRKQKKKNNKADIQPFGSSGDEPVHIRLSNKTGLPLGVVPVQSMQQEEKEEDPYDDETATGWGGGTASVISVNKGEKRNKQESKEQKKLRKIQAKQEKQVARIQKKLLKEAVAEEFMKRSAQVCSDGDVIGKPVFRYS